MMCVKRVLVTMNTVGLVGQNDDRGELYLHVVGRSNPSQFQNLGFLHFIQFFVSSLLASKRSWIEDGHDE